MRTVKVKICGITREEDVRIASDSGADAVGFVVGVPSSPRNVTLRKAESLVKLVPLFVTSVLVTVPTGIDGLKKMFEALNTDAVQIHGEVIPDATALRANLPNTHLIRAVKVNPIDARKGVLEASKSFDAVLLDSSAQGKYGGTGIVHDWHLSRGVRDAIHPTPLLLAGGLTPENVQEAIHTVHPYAVDISTGVESRPGVKDPAKVSTFITKAKEIKLCDT